MANREIKLVEIARSFSRKINLGNYETADFFCSQKTETTPKQAEKVSEELFKFCESEVMKSVGEYWFKNPPKPKKTTKQDFIQAVKEAPEKQAEQDLGDEIGGERKEEDEEEYRKLPIIEE